MRQHLPGGDQPARWVSLEIALLAAHKQFRAAGDPRVVRGDMIRHVVQEQPDTPRGQGCPGRGQPAGAAEGGVGHVAVDAVRRSDYVTALQVGQGILE